MRERTIEKTAKDIISSTLDLQLALQKSTAHQPSSQTLRLLCNIQRSARSILTASKKIADRPQQSIVRQGRPEDEKMA